MEWKDFFGFSVTTYYCAGTEYITPLMPRPLSTPFGRFLYLNSQVLGPPSLLDFSSQGPLGETGQNETGLMNLLVVIPTQLLLLVGIPMSERDLDVTGGVLAADHEADLARRVGRDRRVGVFNHGENFLTRSFELGDEREVKPLVFGYRGKRRRGEEREELALWVVGFERKKNEFGREEKGGEGEKQTGGE